MLECFGVSSKSDGEDDATVSKDRAGRVVPGTALVDEARWPKSRVVCFVLSGRFRFDFR